MYKLKFRINFNLYNLIILNLIIYFIYNIYIYIYIICYINNIYIYIYIYARRYN